MNNFKEHIFPLESFIGGWYMPENICDNIIEYFKNNDHLVVDGAFHTYEKNKIIDVNSKNSKDIKISKDKFDHPFFEYRNNLQDVLSNYLKKYKYVNMLGKFNINENYNIQYYDVGGGFKIYHSERTSKDVSKRVLVFMTYLNDVEDGGTQFLYQNLTSPAKKGLTIIWPAEWTHTHKGQVSITQEKYIVTGWYSFNE